MAGKKNKDQLDYFLNDITQRITANFNVDEIILFGSYAKGTETDDSDIDIAVISPELNINYPMFENAQTIIRKTNLYEPYLQLIPIHSKKFYEETHIDPGFIREIKRTGRRIYTKEAGLIPISA